MATKASRAALIATWVNTNILNNILKLITPALMRTAVTDLYDTLISEYQTVADITTLNALSLGTDFKENDFVFVSDIGKGDTIGCYQYIKNQSGTYTWLKKYELGNKTKLIEAVQVTLALYISAEYSNGDLDIGYMLKLPNGYIYVVKSQAGTYIGDTSTDYELIYSGISGASYHVAATIAARDALILNTDFIIGDFCSVTDDGYGRTSIYVYNYNTNTSTNDWNLTGSSVIM